MQKKEKVCKKRTYKTFIIKQHNSENNLWNVVLSDKSIYNINKKFVQLIIYIQ